MWETEQRLVVSLQDVTSSSTLLPTSCATPTATLTTSAAPCSTCSPRPTRRPSRSRSPGEQRWPSSLSTLKVQASASQPGSFRVLLERLIVNRPHPWGLLITFIELIKNPAFKFWSHDFVHCAPEIEKYVGGQRGGGGRVVADVLWRALMSSLLLCQAVPVGSAVLHGTEAGPAGDGRYRSQLVWARARPPLHRRRWRHQHPSTRR